MSDDRYPDLSPGVKARIAAGQVPPPRKYGDADDPQRDLAFAAAVAEDAGNWSEVDRLNAQRLDLARRGVEMEWEGPKVSVNPLGALTHDDLITEARKAEASGDHDRAHHLKVKAMHAPDKDGLDAVRAANTAEDPASSEADRLRAKSLRAMRGDPEPTTAPAPPAQPQTPEEFNAAIAAAEAEGDHHEGDRLRAGLLALNRRRNDRTVSY